MKSLSSLVVSLVAMIASSVVSAQQSTASSCDDPNQAKKETIAVLKDLSGNVLVSDKSGISSAAAGLRVANSARVTTTANAAVVVSFDCGCDVRLAENQRIDVQLPSGCGALIAAVQPVPVAAALGATTTASSALLTPTGLLVTGAVGVGGYALLRRDRNVSPN
jgi:hypothetical protein